MTGLADVDGFNICIQVYIWLGFPPLIFESFGMTQWKSHNALAFFRLITVLKFHNAHKNQVALLSGYGKTLTC